MSQLQQKPANTLITFDLRQVLQPEELKQFQKAAKEAGAKDLTEHFLNLTLHLPQLKAA